MGVLSLYFFPFFNRKLCLKVTKLNQTTGSLAKSEVDTYGASVFEPNVLVAQMCTNSHEHPMYFRFLRIFHLIYFLFQTRTEQEKAGTSLTKLFLIVFDALAE